MPSEALSDGRSTPFRFSLKMVSQQFISMLRNSALHLSRPFNDSASALWRKNKNGRMSRPFCSLPMAFADAYF
jgi:hypothetical protein